MTEEEWVIEFVFGVRFFLCVRASDGVMDCGWLGLGVYSFFCGCTPC